MLAVITHHADSPDPRVSMSQVPHDIPAGIRASVVDQNKLMGALGCAEHRFDARYEGRQDARAVEHRDDDR